MSCMFSCTATYFNIAKGGIIPDHVSLGFLSFYGFQFKIHTKRDNSLACRQGEQLPRWHRCSHLWSPQVSFLPHTSSHICSSCWKQVWFILVECLHSCRILKYVYLFDWCLPKFTYICAANLRVGGNPPVAGETHGRSAGWQKTFQHVAQQEAVMRQTLTTVTVLMRDL